MNRPARPLVESALLAALGAVFILISFYVPVLGMLATFISPLPAAFVVIRHGVRWGFLSSIVSLMVLMPFISPFTAIALWAAYGALGIALGYSVRRQMSPERAICLAALAALFGSVVDFVAAYLATGLTPRVIAEQLDAAYRMAAETIEKMLGPNPSLDQMVKTVSADVIIRILPVSFVLGAFIMAWLNYEVMRRIVPRFGYSMESLRPFHRWIMPEVLAHAWIAVIIAAQLQQFYADKYPGVLVVLENLATAASMSMTLNALAAISFFLRRAGVTGGMLGLFTFMVFSIIFSSPALALAAQLFGMIDVLFDLRHLRYPELEGI